MRLDRFYNLTILKTDLGTGLGVRPICKLANSLTNTSNNVHGPKTYNKAIHDYIHGNK